ncbi:unnamed protein product [Cylindrotheca closterium]|uniref:Uncharacterized protein n=1 Tax=Cylindrotheca closterium TaxID=2856 RepID=A0AAD2CVB4_9STRA|nr:unnamed protein product [Cylindrotheca closterium]
MAEDPTEESFIRARDLYINNVLSSTIYSYKEAMIDAGIQEAFASLSIYQHHVKLKVINSKTSGNPQIDMSEKGKKERFRKLYRLLYEVAKLRGQSKNPDIAGTMRKAGYTEAELYEIQETKKKNPSRFYVQCSRLANRIRKELDEKKMIQISIHDACIPKTIVEERVDEEEEVSPISAATSDDTYFSFSSNRDTGSHGLEPLPEAQKLPTKSDDASVKSTTSAISSITTQSAPKRKTPAQKQQERRDRAHLEMLRKCAYKIGSVAYSLKEQNPCEALKGASNCADQVNRMFGIELITGRQLREAVKHNNVGKSPPRVGRPTLLSDRDFTNLRDAFWSSSAIDQNNVDASRLTRAEEKTVLDEVVNDKRLKDGNVAIDAVKLMERIDVDNAPRQNIVMVDERRQLRTEWCTKANQMKHYQKWEEKMIERGYARLPTNEKERAHGYITFLPGQEKRNTNMDEMKFTLDASTESRGGRPSHSHTTSSISEGGKADKTPDTSCTIVMAVNDDEPLPPCVIFKTTAKDGNGTISARNLQLDERGRLLYPDCQDIKGKRVLLKVDSGPGRQAAKVLGETRVEGVDIFPGLPNASECNQEMDQLFGPYKDSVYSNRNKLINAKGKLTLLDVGYCLFGGQVTLDNGKILDLEESFKLHFTPAKIRSAREKCGYCPATRRALEDPKMRDETNEVNDDEDALEAPKRRDEINEVNDDEDALEDPKLIEEIDVVDDDEDTLEDPNIVDEINEVNLDEDALGDPKIVDEISKVDDDEAEELTSMTKVLLKVEKMNHRAVDELISCGYTLASKLRRTVRRVTRRSFGKGIVTAPGSRERQELFAKMTRAGDYFRITGGGGVINTADVLIGLEIKGMKKEVEKELKRKKVLQSFYSCRRRATKLMQEKHYMNWTRTDFATAISYKRGPFYKCEKGDRTISSIKKLQVPELKKYYEETYKDKPSAWRRQEIWTIKNEKELERLKTGKVSHYTETRIYGDALETQNFWVQKKFESISRERQIKVLSEIFKNLDEEVVDSVVNSLPDDKRTLLHDCLNRAPSSDDDEDLDNSSSIHFCEADLEFASQWNDDDTLVENEMTEAEMECAAILEEECQENQNTGEEVGTDEDFDSDDSIADDNHGILKDIEINATPDDGYRSVAAESSDDSSCASAGSFEMQDDAASDDEDKSMDRIGREPSREPTVSPTNAGGSELQISTTHNGRAVDESIENEIDTVIEDTITEIEVSKDAQTKIALYNLLINSRGKKVGNRRREEALKRRWMEVKAEPLVWSVDDLKSKLADLKSNQAEWVHSC